MSNDTIFSKIIQREAPADILYQDDLVTAFRDANPKAPTHILIVPNRVIPTSDDVARNDEPVLGRMFTVASEIARVLSRKLPYPDNRERGCDAVAEDG